MKNTNNNGLSLIEVIISMAISSIVLVMLTQMLSMNIQMKNKIETDNVLFNQSSSITNTIQNNMFDLQAQKVERQINSDPTDLSIVIYITHLYDIEINPVTGFVEQKYIDEADLEPDILIYDPVAQKLTYNGVDMHSGYIKIVEGTDITVIPKDQEACDATPGSSACDGVILKLDLQITYQRDLLDIETQLDPQQFVSTLII